MTDTQHDDDPTSADVTASAIREHLRTIATHWDTTSDPMRLGDGTGGSYGARLPGSTVQLRADVTLTLAYWVHAMVDEWPSVLQHLERVPIPTTDRDHTGWTLIVVTGSLDCTDVHAMAAILGREADRLADWETFGPTLVDELGPLASAVRHVAKPPRHDTVTIGECDHCGDPVKVKLTERVPQPTTDPGAYPLWTKVPTAIIRTAIIRHPCGIARTLDEWHDKLIGPRRPMVAGDIVHEIHQRLGLRYSATTVRVWSKRRLITTRGYSSTGESLYDLREVLEALVSREATRDALLA